MSILWTLYFLYMQYHAEAQTGPRHDVLAVSRWRSSWEAGCPFEMPFDTMPITCWRVSLQCYNIIRMEPTWMILGQRPTYVKRTRNASVSL